MDIAFNCEKCGQHLVIDQTATGAAVQCPSCGTALKVPAYIPSQSDTARATVMPAKKRSHIPLLIGVVFIFLLSTGTIVTWLFYRAHKELGRVQTTLEKSLQKDIQSASKQTSPEQAANVLYVAAGKDLAEASSSTGMVRTVALAKAFSRFSKIINDYPSSSVAVDIVRHSGVEALGRTVPISQFQTIGEDTIRILDHMSSLDTFLQFIADNEESLLKGRKELPSGWVLALWKYHKQDWQWFTKTQPEDFSTKLRSIICLLFGEQETLAKELIASLPAKEKQLCEDFLQKGGLNKIRGKGRANASATNQTSVSWLDYWKDFPDRRVQLMRLSKELRSLPIKKDEALFKSVVAHAVNGRDFEAVSQIEMKYPLFRHQFIAATAVETYENGNVKSAMDLLAYGRGRLIADKDEISQNDIVPYVQACVYMDLLSSAKQIAAMITGNLREKAMECVCAAQIAKALTETNLNAIAVCVTRDCPNTSQFKELFILDIVNSFLALDDPIDALAVARENNQIEAELPIAAYLMLKNKKSDALDIMAHAASAKDFPVVSYRVALIMLRLMHPEIIQSISEILNAETAQ